MSDDDIGTGFKAIRDILEKLIKDMESTNKRLNSIEYRLKEIRFQNDKQEMDIEYLKSRTQPLDVIGGFNL